MRLKINGESKDLENGHVSVFDLLVSEKVTQPDMVSVQLNGEFVSRSDFPTTRVKDGDEIDFLYFMGGGNR